MLRFVCAGSWARQRPGWSATALMGNVDFTSLVALVSSLKYSICTDCTPAPREENRASMRTGSLARMSVLPLVADTALMAVTTGSGAVTVTALARPGDGPAASGEASQLAGSFDAHAAAARSSERPRYWCWLSSMPVQSDSAPNALAPMGQGRALSYETASSTLPSGFSRRTVSPRLPSPPSHGPNTVPGGRA